MSTSDHGYHRPVLLKESVDGLNIKPDGVYVDVTFGGGGHSREILTRLDNGKLIAFDQDPDAAANLPDDKRIQLIPQNFRNMSNWIRYAGFSQVDGILADLGVSSHQFDESERGFSIRFDGPLDMRMNPAQGKTAAQVLNDSEPETLEHIFKHYGEVINARRLVREVMNRRPVHSTAQLMEIIRPLAQRGKEHKYAAQVFQALRIEVNDELNVLREFLMQSARLIRTGGRLVVISYHSLEDRMVKDFMRSGNTEGVLNKDFYGNLHRPFDPLSGKAIVPDEEENTLNTRARSAKLRIAERTSEPAE
jgi:16S rRNA (cytosine1402-N4)-methyltransferase